MKTPRVAEALQHIDDELISEAIEFHRIAPSRKLLKICACFLVIAVAVGIGFFRFGDKSDSVSPFVLSAYAISDDAYSIQSSELTVGKKVPISPFETENGILCFIFGYDKTEKRSQSWNTFIMEEDYNAPVDEIHKAIADDMQDHYIYIPDRSKTAPYNLTLFRTNWETNIVYRCEICIMQIDGNYCAELICTEIGEAIPMGD